MYLLTGASEPLLSGFHVLCCIGNHFCLLLHGFTLTQQRSVGWMEMSQQTDPCPRTGCAFTKPPCPRLLHPVGGRNLPLIFWASFVSKVAKFCSVRVFWAGLRAGTIQIHPLLLDSPEVRMHWAEGGKVRQTLIPSAKKIHPKMRVAVAGSKEELSSGN